MSDSKKDLTRIEDLGEYLHLLDEDKDYLPELPRESEDPILMEETLISEDSFSNPEEDTPSFESDLSEFSTENSEFDSGSNFGESETEFESSNDFSGETSFESGNEFEIEGFTSNIDDGEFTLTENETEPETDSLLFTEEEDPFSEKEISEEQVELTPTEDDNQSFNTQTSSFEIDLSPIEDTNLIIKTPLPETTPVSTFQEPENFADLKKFAQNSGFGGIASEGNPSFSVLLKEIKYLEDAQDILSLLKELGLTTDSDEVLMNRLSRGEFLVPRISEFAATFLAHKIRRFDIDILIGLSDEIHPPKHSEEPEIGLVSKLTLYQNQSHHFQFDETNLDISQIILSATPTLDGHQVIKYIGVASEHKILEGHLVEDENSLEVSSYYHELAHKLKAHALKSNANAVVGLNYQLTPLPSNYGSSNTRYRLTCTGNLVWINRV